MQTIWIFYTFLYSEMTGLISPVFSWDIDPGNDPLILCRFCAHEIKKESHFHVTL